MRLWRRAWRVVLGDILIEGSSQKQSLDIEFSVEKNIKKTPNTAVCKIYNLDQSRRSQLQDQKNLRLEISAGYEGRMSRLFIGDIHVSASSRRKKRKKSRIHSVMDAADIVTTVEAADSGRRYSSSEIQRSYRDGTSTQTVLRDVVDAMGIGEGNLSSAPAQIYTEGTVVTGRAWRALDRIVRSLNLTWSVQDGALQLLSGGRPLQQTAIRLTPQTGLVGSPAADVDQTVTCTSLLIPGLTPGRQVVLESALVSGSYRIRRVSYVGVTIGADWYAKLTLERY
jgi:hypothetical protein